MVAASGHIERPVYQAMNVGGAKDDEIMVEAPRTTLSHPKILQK